LSHTSPSARAVRFRILAAVVLVALTVPRLWQRGMFVDGVVWASLARNLSIGIGTLWTPHYTDTTYRSFYEHPPLGWGLESLAFRLLGDTPATERVYSLIVFAIAAALMVAIWRRLLDSRYDWLPLFFWVLPSIVTWGVINNMLENTQTMCTCAAVYVALRACTAKTGSRTAMWAAGAGVAAVAGALVKGPVALFVLALPALFVLLPANSRPRRPWLLAGALVGTVAIVAMALYAYGPSHAGIGEYLRTQLFASLAGRREINTTPLRASWRLFGAIIMRMLFIVAVLYLVRRRRVPVEPPPRAAWFFLATAVTASLPLLVSPRLSDHYFLPSAAFYALAAGAFALPLVRTFGDEPSRTWLRHLPLTFAAALATAAVLVPMVHGPIEPRSVEMLRDVDGIAGTLPPGATVGACAQSDGEWGLRGYLERLQRLSFDATGTPVNGWFLEYHAACPVPAGCRQAAGGEALTLYRCSL